jgi:hypothetical protein
VAVTGALGCGAAIAAVQLVLSWTYAQWVGTTSRPLQDLMYYAYPPAHWAELAIPQLFQHVAGGPDGAYWAARATTGYEARLYLGTVPLILAFVGMAGREPALAPWRLIVPASFALATMPLWWPLGYQLILQLPGIGYFRAPARYTIITTLGLALLAGRGFDRAVPHARFTTGVSVAVVFCCAAFAWTIFWTRLHAEAFSPADVATVLTWTAIAWLSSLGVIVAWRRRLIGPLWPFAVAVLELGVLFYQGTTVWTRATDVVSGSPVLRRLSEEKAAGTVVGDLKNLPIYVGRAATFPYLGMRMPLPTGAMEFARFDTAFSYPGAVRLLVRMGATHAISQASISGVGIEEVYAGGDEVLDRLLNKTTVTPERATWHLSRLPIAPTVHVARRAVDAPDFPTVLAYLAQDSSYDVAWFLPGDRPADPPGPRARTVHIVNWSGLAGEVEHDGTCDVVVLRTYAAGWFARLNDGPPIPVNRVDGGLQSIRLTGSGPTRISLEYHTPRLLPAAGISLLALLLVLGTLYRHPLIWRTGDNSAGGPASASRTSLSDSRKTWIE